MKRTFTASDLVAAADIIDATRAQEAAAAAEAAVEMAAAAAIAALPEQECNIRRAYAAVAAIVADSETAQAASASVAVRIARFVDDNLHLYILSPDGINPEKSPKKYLARVLDLSARTINAYYAIGRFLIERPEYNRIPYRKLTLIVGKDTIPTPERLAAMSTEDITALYAAAKPGKPEKAPEAETAPKKAAPALKDAPLTFDESVSVENGDVSSPVPKAIKLNFAAVFHFNGACLETECDGLFTFDEAVAVLRAAYAEAASMQ